MKLIAAAFGLLLSGIGFADSKPAGDSLEGAIEAIVVPEPTERKPVSVVTAVFPGNAKPGEMVTVAVKVRIKPGWRIYRYVPPTEAYMPTKWILELSDGAEKSGDWLKPQPEYLPGHSDILIYQGEQVFTHQVVISESAQGEVTLTAGLNYQTCNDDMCLRPTKKTTELTISVK